jgi:hypothetical protein
MKRTPEPKGPVRGLTEVWWKSPAKGTTKTHRVAE